MARIEAESLRIGYAEANVVDGLNVRIPEGKVTSIIGPNGCGKSTILKALSRMIPCRAGRVILDGQAIAQMPTLEIARRMAVLPQTPVAPAGLSVEELTAFGRYPHQKGFARLNARDKQIVRWALEITGMVDLRESEVDRLSGGQRQRAWIAMALAQDTPLILLDEPTTYLDMAHQLEVLQLLQKLNRESGRTIAMVLHDLNLAARFSDYMIAVRSGAIVTEGAPKEIMTPRVLKELFSIEANIVPDPKTQLPVCISFELLNTGA